MQTQIRQRQLIPFLMVGDPNIETTELIADEMIAEGVHTLELGLAFSDPMADGPVIQRASARALAAGANLVAVLKLTERLKRKHPHVRIILFSYLNPLLRFGLENYVLRALEAGVNATLTVDLPVEESAEYLDLHRKFGLGTVFLASPTTTPARLLKIAQASSEFVYYVSRLGVTGEQSTISATLAKEIASLKQHVSLPIAVGFGISTAQQAGTIATYADHVVIGSRFIQLIEQNLITSNHSQCRTASAIVNASVNASVNAAVNAAVNGTVTETVNERLALALTMALLRKFVRDCHEQIHEQVSVIESRGDCLANIDGRGHK